MEKGIIVVVCPQCGMKNRVARARIADQACCGCRAMLPLDIASPVEITDASFENDVASFPGPILVNFHTPRCGYCKMLAPVIDELAAGYAGRVRIGKLDVDANPAAASRCAIRGTPTLILFRHGKAVKTMVGVMDIREMERALNSKL